MNVLNALFSWDTAGRYNFSGVTPHMTFSRVKTTARRDKACYIHVACAFEHDCLLQHCLGLKVFRFTLGDGIGMGVGLGMGVG